MLSDDDKRANDDTFWDNSLGGWDRLRLGPHTLPGIWEVSARARKIIDVKKSAGKDGAHVFDRGYEPAPVTLRGRMHQYSDWISLQAIFKDNAAPIHPRKKGGARNPFDIYHPALDLLGITQVSIVEVSVEPPKGGIFEISIECIEWFTDPKTVNKPKTAGGLSTDEDAEMLGEQNESNPIIDPPSSDALGLLNQSGDPSNVLASLP